MKRVILFYVGIGIFVFLLIWADKASAEPPPTDHPFCQPQVSPDGGEIATCRNDYERLNEVASIFAMREITVNCYTQEAWDSNYYFYGAWGITFMDPWFASIEMPDFLCNELLGLTEQGQPEVRWRAALAVIVLVHESYHARFWTWRKSEAKVGCRAIRHFRVGLGLLWGYHSYDLFRDLWPHAVALYYRQQIKFPEYAKKDCRVQYP